MYRLCIKLLIAIIITFILFAEWYFLLSGKLYLSELKVVLINDNPGYYRITDDQSPGDRIGTLDKMAGDTVTSIGMYRVGGWANFYYLTVVGVASLHFTFRSAHAR